MVFTKPVLIRASIFLLASAVLLSYAFLTTPNRNGDGHEYSIIAQAFLNHLSPDIRVDDADDRMQELTFYPNTGYHKKIFNAMKQLVSVGVKNEYGWFKAKNSQYYGYHFWLYPAYVASVEAISNKLGANPFASFQIANSLLLIAVMAYVLFKVNGSLLRQFAIILAFSLGGVQFYLKWTHPEFFIASFLFLGFIALFQRVFWLALLSFALVAMQVISLWAVFAVIPLWLFLHDRDHFGLEIKRLAKQWWVWLCCLLPITSPVFYYLNFGKINLIAANYTDIELVSWSHLYSFWFDLDQGVFVGVPWLLLVLLVFLFRIKAISAQCRFDFWIAVMAGMFICLPLLAQTSVNSGQSVFQRYALYAVCPLTAWAGYYFLDIINKQYLKLLLLFSAIGYAAAFSGTNALEDNTHHKPWTRLILENFPDSYNPEPGCFYARTPHAGRVEWVKWSENIVTYKDLHGIIRKILFPINNTKTALSKFCSGQIVDAQGVPADFTKGMHEAYGWAYLNGVMHCDGLELTTPTINLLPQYSTTLRSGIDFSRDGFPEWLKFANGLSSYDGIGRWSDGATITLKIKAILPNHFNLTFLVMAYAENVGKPVTVSVNGVSNSFVADSDTLKSYSINFELEHPVTEAIIKISIAHPISPQQLGLSKDSRQLGLYFSKIGFDF